MYFRRYGDMDYDIECLGVSPEILPQDGRVTIQGQGPIFWTTEIYFMAACS